MAGFQIDALVFDGLVAHYLPELHKHFQKVNLGCTILTAPWFLCLFVNDLPVETAFVVSSFLFLFIFLSALEYYFATSFTIF
jgi:Rab-GTPase-TBC domain